MIRLNILIDQRSGSVWAQKWDSMRLEKLSPVDPALVKIVPLGRSVRWLAAQPPISNFVQKKSTPTTIFHFWKFLSQMSDFFSTSSDQKNSELKIQMLPKKFDIEQKPQNDCFLISPKTRHLNAADVPLMNFGRVFTISVWLYFEFINSMS